MNMSKNIINQTLTKTVIVKTHYLGFFIGLVDMQQKHQ